MIDIVFVAVPYIETREPIMSPALLKAVVEKHGYSSVGLDLNIEFVNRIEDHPKKKDIINFFEFAEEKPELSDEIFDLINFISDRILSYNPQVIGLSLLTYNSQLFTLWLLVKLKMVAPHIKIIIGGSGIKDFIASSSNAFCDEMKSLNLIDHYITGDGEIAVVEFLKGNFEYPGINSLTWQEIRNLDDFPFPDYADYDFDYYDVQKIPITDSRGCVRSCKFCDIIEHWKKYVYRSAESVFAEMLCQIDRYKITNFTMRNSLTNGNMKEFRKLLSLIGEYNKHKLYHEQIRWQGYFIVREKNQHPEEIFQQIQKSNGTLMLGVESVIEHVRHEMGKKFSNASIDYHLEMTQKYKVPISLLIMTGNPTETREDYRFTKQWFRERYQYAGNSVYKVHLSISSILPGTEWERTQDQLNLQLGKYPAIWMNQDLKITSQERVDYWKELMEICVPYQNETSLAGSSKWQNSTISVIENVH